MSTHQIDVSPNHSVKLVKNCKSCVYQTSLSPFVLVCVAVFSEAMSAIDDCNSAEGSPPICVD